MPRVAVPVTQINRAGVAPGTETNGDATNNHTVANNGRMFLEVRNSSSTVARTVTFRFPTVVDGQAVTPRAVSIPISSTRRFGPFPTGDYGSQLQVDVDNAELKLTAYGL
ncbi:hypothetical protein [Streptomyces justiciae]|uniref:Uncharacterized protein n=1 Tax=Streptomyces justiciae TaxID=2780140 RepID=A0ABU3M701_9ACTN|nr:hypothetical protein [Streptomyces justiciae]MDT7847210.1 hypothetical protein [Streptomyces justiciae]